MQALHKTSYICVCVIAARRPKVAKQRNYRDALSLSLVEEIYLYMRNNIGWAANGDAKCRYIYFTHFQLRCPVEKNQTLNFPPDLSLEFSPDFSPISPCTVIFLFFTVKKIFFYQLKLFLHI